MQYSYYGAVWEGSDRFKAGSTQLCSRAKEILSGNYPEAVILSNPLCGKVPFGYRSSRPGIALSSHFREIFWDVYPVLLRSGLIISEID